MKRSESMLVYGVTVILLVIVGVAVIFGNGPAVQGNETSSSGLGKFLIDPDLSPPGDGSEPARGFDVDDDPSTTQDPVEDLSTDGEGQPGGSAAEGDGGDVVPSDVQPFEVMLADLGPSVVVQSYDNRYRRVRVEAGMSFEEICRRFAPGYEPNDVHILNEEIDPSDLELGSELLVLYVPDEKLIEAYKVSLAGQSIDRLGSRGRSGPGAGLVPPGNSSTSASGTARSHLVVEGDSLWAIAKDQVGARRATAYAEEIRIANGLPSNKIIPGKTLVLPGR